ncbi:MAG: DHH family phosphoesterase [Lachnospiraceae bacterium]|uniref:Cyclic-di-AMP phosphodiesterase n=1 Tax=Candidatus Weimeria bifida TaxID=2599074 RepID=A0A6N7J1J5_9FIRM|nr:DHH family phosphoesterase [Candidatus Weimeria bifida]RRF95280.1 MAG: DHH family phosphoesterase [Lachnospiraceae bacterium]
MDPMKKGYIRTYLMIPIYLIPLFIVATIVLYVNAGIKSGNVMLIVTICYSAVVTIAYLSEKKKITDEIIEFAAEYGTVQKQLLKNFQLPYAVLDENGRFMWMNESFSRSTQEDPSYKKSIANIFPELSREALEKIESEPVSIRVNHGDHVYDAVLQKMEFKPETEKNNSDFSIMLGGTLFSVMLFDETEYEKLKESFNDQKLISGLIYIDNYDEAIDSLDDDVKKSLIIAIIDRKIAKYFRQADAIIRKTDTDKYFIIFQQKYLKKLEENKFSVLEDVKNTKVGNDQEVTLSIGLGKDARTYSQSAEYARAAIDLALGRGGSQVVVKSRNHVSYYGVRGKEVEKTTRVKARVKAQALREMMETKDSVIVMGHQITDVDALGAAVGVYCAARELGKKCQIVLNTITTSLRPLVDKFTPAEGYPEDMFINSERAIELVNDNTLVMVVDTNRPSYTECPELLERSQSIVVFDHHRQGSERIENPLLSYIEPYASSACEMIAETLQYFSERMQLAPQEADCIYAGILIDTNNFMTKTGVRTFEAAAYLKRSGAEVTRVRKLLREDMATYKARAEVVRHAEVYRGSFAISVCQTDEVESPTIVGAQASNELLNIVGIKASFVITEYKGKIYVSARSIDEIDVQLIMERLGGGGHLNVAGAQLSGATVDEVKRKIKDILDAMIEEGEIRE